METRTWNNSPISTSLLGFGCMRFPRLEDGSIDEVTAEQMLQRAKDAGVNYYDTAYPYHNGDSEPFVGRVLAKWERSSFYLATKLPCWNVSSLEDAEKIFTQQLERLGVEYVDFYLLHALNGDRYRQMKELGVVEWGWKLKEQGKIRHFGFSFHDDYPVFEEILLDQPWDFCQIQYNYMDTQIQAGDKGYALAEEKGIPMIIMEPIKGGTLASLPEDASAPLKALRPDASVSSWALRWVASHSNVKVVLSGMSTPQQVEDNLDTFLNFQVLNDAEQAAVDETAAILRSRIRIGCTACRYCMPCPKGVNIPGSFAIWNTGAMYDNKEATRKSWADFSPNEKPIHCVGCGACEQACPQHLPIRQALAQLQQELDSL